MKTEFTWPEILEESNDFFKDKSEFELALSFLFEKAILGKAYSERKALVFFLPEIVFTILKLSFKLPKKWLSVNTSSFLSCINLNRSNDFGIIYPILIELKKAGIPISLILTKNCFEERKNDFKKLDCQIFLRDIFKRSNLRGQFSIKLMFQSIKMVIKSIIQFSNYHKEFINRCHNVTACNFFIKKNLFALIIFLQHRCNVTILERIFKDKLPKGILSLGEREFGIFGRQIKVPVYAIQHGTFTSEGISKWTPFTPSNSSKIILYGEEFVEIAQKVYPNSNFIALGNPIYDNLKTTPCDLNKDNLTITFFSCQHTFWGNKKKNLGPVFDRRDIGEAYLDFLIKLYHQGKHVIRLKPHPNDDVDEITEYNALFGNEINISEAKNSYEEIEQTDVCIAFQSTVLLESVLCRKPAIDLILFNQNEIPYFPLKYAIKISNYEDLIKILNDICTQDSYRTLTNQQFNQSRTYVSNLGSASKDISEFIKRELNG